MCKRLKNQCLTQFLCRQFGLSLICLLLSGAAHALQNSLPVQHTVVVDDHPMSVWAKIPENPTRVILLVHGRTWSTRPDFDLQVEGESLSLMDGFTRMGLDASEVTVPTLLLEGQLDPLAIDDVHAALFTALATPDKAWVVIPGGDHAAFMESPRSYFLSAIESFLYRGREDDIR